MQNSVTRSMLWLVGGALGGALVTFASCRPSSVTRGDAASQMPASALAASSSMSAPSGAAVPVPTAPAPGLSPNARTEDERNTIDVFRLAAPATVFVTQRRLVQDNWGDVREVEAGSGSGFIWDTAGHIVTNAHVVEGARSLVVSLHNQKTVEAQLVGVEPKKDIAVLKVDLPPADLVPVRVASGKQTLEVGQKTIAIGNPFGLDHTLTTGIVSALGRNQPGFGGVTIRDMIQTDAAINPGNSGGPLLDSGGQLIGMNTMIYSKSGASAGVGFAVPVSTIARVVPQIIRTGRAQSVGLGIGLAPQNIQKRLEQAGVNGLLVWTVPRGAPAEKAGMRGSQLTRSGVVLGDIIVGVDNKPVQTYDDLYTLLDAHNPGDVVPVKVLRDGDKTVVLNVTVGVLNN